MYRKIFVIYLISILLSSSPAFAGTCWNGGSSGSTPWTVKSAADHNADSCADVDVNYCVGAVAVGGDTVNVPAGTCIWTTKVTFNKSLNIIGAGIGNTIITGNTGIIYGDCPIWVNSAGGGLTIRISGFTFQSISIPSEGMIYIAGPDNIIRIDHNRFYNMTARSIWVAGLRIKGVIDHNTFHTDAAGTLNVQAVFIRGSANSQASADTSWTIPLEWGTDKFIYIEDNTFTYDLTPDGLCDCENGGRYVFRYNTVNGVNGGSLGGHGYDSVARSCMAKAVYNNTFSNSAANSYAIQFRGGTGVVYNNTVTGTWSAPFALTNYRSCDGCSTVANSDPCVPNSSGLCNNSGRCNDAPPKKRTHS